MQSRDLIKKYLRFDRNLTALLTFGGTVLNVRPSPMVAGFSSRAPNTVTPYILKPDVIGPGVNILATWSEAVGPTGFNIKSSTISSLSLFLHTSLELSNVKLTFLYQYFFFFYM